jgi:hypothetical protein
MSRVGQPLYDEPSGSSEASGTVVCMAVWEGGGHGIFPS